MDSYYVYSGFHGRYLGLILSLWGKGSEMLGGGICGCLSEYIGWFMKKNTCCVARLSCHVEWYDFDNWRVVVGMIQFRKNRRYYNEYEK